MPVIPNTVPVVEIIQSGIVAAKGSSVKNSVIVSHWMRSAGTVAPNSANVESAYQAAIAIPITNALNNRYSQTFNTCRVINDVLYLATQVSRAVAGQVTGDSMPTFNSAFLLLRTAFRGKSFRGAKKLFPLSESDTTGSTADLLNAGALTNFGAIASAIIAGFTDSDGNIWVPIVLSKKLSLLKKNPVTINGATVISVLINKRVGRMRKREVASVY